MGASGKYAAFRRARTAIWLALRARHLALAAAGTRQSHTYHQYASACRAPAATTRTAPDYAPYSPTRPPALQRGTIHRTGAATIAVAPIASAATPMVSSA